MPVYVAFLRGVNVVGSSVMKMAALREMCCGLRFQDVQTYVQSGNIVFRAREISQSALAERLASGIEKRFGFRPQVMLRTPSDLRAVVGANPFGKRKDVHPSKLLVNFLLTRPSAELRAKLEAVEPLSAEEIHLVGRELFIYFPGGIGASKTRGVLDRLLETTATGRNWNSVVNVLAMAEELER